MNLKEQNIANHMNIARQGQLHRQVPQSRHHAYTESLCNMHDACVMKRKRNREQHWIKAGGYFSTEDALAYDKELERQISIFGQVFNPRISAKAYRALNHSI